MKRLTTLASVIFVMIALLVVLGLAGCGSSAKAVRSDSQADGGEDIDALLGLTDDTPAEESSVAGEETIGEDDVLKLLGVEQSGAETERKTAAITPPAKTDPVTTQPAGRTEVTATPVKKETEPIKPAVQPVRRGNAARPFNERYEMARSAYQARQYKKAIQEFEVLLGENMNHSLSDNCQYWIGESYWGLGKYQQAAAAFEKVFTFAKSNKDVDAQLKLGLCYLRLNDKSRAREEFQKLIDNYPSSNRVTAARRYIADIDAGQ